MRVSRGSNAGLKGVKCGSQGNWESVAQLAFPKPKVRNATRAYLCNPFVICCLLLRVDPQDCNRCAIRLSRRSRRARTSSRSRRLLCRALNVTTALFEKRAHVTGWGRSLC
eukprot:1176904-Prorocentrum_minimum.AAC.9